MSELGTPERVGGLSFIGMSVFVAIYSALIGLGVVTAGRASWAVVTMLLTLVWLSMMFIDAE